MFSTRRRSSNTWSGPIIPFALGKKSHPICRMSGDSFIMRTSAVTWPPARPTPSQSPLVMRHSGSRNGETDRCQFSTSSARTFIFARVPRSSHRRISISVSGTAVSNGRRNTVSDCGGMLTRQQYTDRQKVNILAAGARRDYLYVGISGARASHPHFARALAA